MNIQEKEQFLKSIYSDGELDVLLKKYSEHELYEMSKPVDVEISEIRDMLKNGESILINSPDGFVPVNEFVDKGMYEEYELSYNGNVVRVNENHLFETPDGWKFAKDITTSDKVLYETGEFVDVVVRKTGEVIPIVDIVVGHENHRYYANGFSSHNTNVGKSACMCFLAGEWLKKGEDVLYITLEMSEESVQERIDANLLDIPTDDLTRERLPVDLYRRRAEELKKKKLGKLIVKEYPTSQAHTGHFRHLLNELKIKRGFVPKIIIVDYINICASSKYKGGSNVNSYTLIKSIAEELRGLAVEFEAAILTATQTNRDNSNGSTNIDMTSTSESFGLPMSLDLFIAIVMPPELAERNRQMFILLKSRFGNKNGVKPQLIGIDWSKMRYYDVDKENFNTASNSTVEEVNSKSSKPNFVNKSKDSIKDIAWD